MHLDGRLRINTASVVILGNNIRLRNPCSCNICKQSDAYSEPCQIPKMERFVKTVNVQKPLTFLAKHSTLNVSKDFEYASYQWLHIRTLNKYLGRQDIGS